MARDGQLHYTLYPCTTVGPRSCIGRFFALLEVQVGGDVALDQARSRRRIVGRSMLRCRAATVIFSHSVQL